MTNPNQTEPLDLTEAALGWPPVGGQSDTLSRLGRVRKEMLDHRYGGATPGAGGRGGYLRSSGAVFGGVPALTAALGVSAVVVRHRLLSSSSSSSPRLSLLRVTSLMESLQEGRASGITVALPLGNFALPTPTMLLRPCLFHPRMPPVEITLHLIRLASQFLPLSSRT